MLKYLTVLLAVTAFSVFSGENDPPAKSKAEEARELEAKHLRNIRQITFAGSKNGEAYFSPDGKSIIFQGVREPGNPFYQIYTMNLADGAVRRVSTGKGKTTCSFFHPKKPRVLFGSTHLDPESEAKQKDEIEQSKKPRRYSWDFDPNFDIFESDLDGGNLVQLTNAKGYDAEGSYSPDGTKIVFCSFRDGDGEIYIMDSDGKNQTRLTNEKGYDGGPFFSPDGKKIVWRHFEDEAQKTAEIWTMNIDGSDKKQITSLKSISWAPWYAPSMKWIVFASNFEDPAFELYAIKPDGKDLTRLTYSDGFDGLPVISPNRALMWTSNRSENKSQIFIADLMMADLITPDQPLSTGDVLLGLNSKAFMSRTQGIVDAANTNNVEHHIGKLFMDAGLKPIGTFDEIDETSYVQGPSVAGWLPPSDGDKNLIVVAAPIPTDADSAVNVAALIELVDELKLLKEPHPGIYISTAYPDELPHTIATAQSAMKIVNKDKKPPSIAAFICFSGLGKAKTSELSLVGVGSGAGWRELAERLVARHSFMSLSLEDDPAGASELALKPAVEVPAISIGAPRVVLRPLAEGDDDEVVREHQAAAVATALDCVLQLASRKVEVKYQPYDAAAAKAAASAASRPYLGTIPEYKGAGDGVKLIGVRDGSPAQKSGLQAGDLIVELGGKPIKNVEEYLAALESLKTGEATTIVIKRDGKEQKIDITPASKH